MKPKIQNLPASEPEKVMTGLNMWIIRTIKTCHARALRCDLCREARLPKPAVPSYDSPTPSQGKIMVTGRSPEPGNHILHRYEMMYKVSLPKLTGRATLNLV